MKRLLVFTLFFALAHPSYAALGANGIFQVQSTATAANANGAYFDYGNTHFTTDLACTSATGNSPVCTSASYNFATVDASAWLFIQSGTNWLNSYGGNTATALNGCWYPGVSVSSNALTINAAIGAAICTDLTSGFPTPRLRPSTVAGISSTGSPTAGVWGMDYSQTDSAAFADTDLASVTGTTNPCTVTSVNKPLGVNMTGNGIHITAGTNWTQNWYEIVSVSAVTGTLDKACASSATVTGATFKIGGAASLGSSTANQTDTNFFGVAAAGNRFMIKGAVTYTMGGAVTGAVGTASALIAVEGYQTVRGDAPTGANRPTLAMGAQIFTAGAGNAFYNLIFTGTSTSVVNMGNNDLLLNGKVTNSSTTAARNGINVSGSPVRIENSELVSYRGNALNLSSSGTTLQGDYLHDSNNLISLLGVTSVINNSVLAGAVNAAIIGTSNTSNGIIVIGNTLYGAENKMGTGYSVFTGTTMITWKNNVIYGFVSGITDTDVQNSNQGDYNDYFNNTTDVSPQWAQGSHNIAVNPTFVNVGQVTGTTAVTLSSNRLQDSTKNFTSLGVVAGDFLQVVSGTGPTAGIYGITAITTVTNPNDTLTVDVTLTANATTDKVYQITTGHNFCPNSASGILSAGFPGAFPGGFAIGHLPIGACQPVGTVAGSTAYVQ